MFVYAFIFGVIVGFAVCLRDLHFFDLTFASLFSVGLGLLCGLASVVKGKLEKFVEWLFSGGI